MHHGLFFKHLVDRMRDQPADKGLPTHIAARSPSAAARWRNFLVDVAADQFVDLGSSSHNEQFTS
jgi:hypothetical protein